MVDTPTPDQISGAVNATTAAVSAVKVAWSDWAMILPWALYTLTQAAAMFKSIAGRPGGKWRAGNWGHAENKA